MIVDYASGLNKKALQSSADIFRRNVQLIGQVTGVPVQVESLPQADVNRNGVLNALRNTIVTPTTTLIVSYHGHGGTDGERGHYLHLPANEGPARGPIFRSELLDACVFPARPMLVVLFTDCCSSRVGQVGGAAPFNPDLAQILKNLFLQHRGIVDITAATYYPEKQLGEYGMYDPMLGGFFTLGFGSAIASIPLNKLDTDLDGFVTWAEFFPEVQRETDGIYAASTPQWQKQQLGQWHQIPQAFCLARRSDIDTFTPRYRLGLDVAEDGNGGLVVNRVKPRSPAANIIELNGRRQNGNSHFVRGDRILRLNGQRVRSIFELYTVLEGVPYGESLRIEGRDAVHDNHPYSAMVRLDR
jgi:hypothetical protein